MLSQSISGLIAADYLLFIYCCHIGSQSKSKISKFWIVKSSDEVLEKVASVNARNVAISVGSIDFSTLYTSIVHESLVRELKWVVRKAFKDSSKRRIAVYKERAQWVDKPKESTKSVGEEELIEMIKYLIGSTAFEYGGVVWSQWIGIPMGTDCAPYLANLYLFALEYKWIARMEEGRRKEPDRVRGKEEAIEEWKEEDRKVRLGEVKRLRTVSRYIDDGLVVNGIDIVMKYIEEIYRHDSEKRE